MMPTDVTTKYSDKPVTEFSVLFYKPLNKGSIEDRVFTKGLIDYYRVFGYEGYVVHCSIKFGNYVYEVTKEGTVKYLYTDLLLQDERLSYVYKLNIEDMGNSKKQVAHFALENYIGRKLDIAKSLRYLYNVNPMFKSDRDMTEIAIDSRQNNISCEEGSFKGSSFNLPYTCTTPANTVLRLLLDFEVGFTGHLAESLFYTLEQFADYGIGKLEEYYS